MPRVVEGARVGDHRPQVHAELAAEQRVLDRLFVVHGFAPAGSTQGHGGHRQKIDAGQDPIVLRDEGGTDVLRLRVEAPAVVLLQVVALHQVELEIWRELSPVALLEATEDRDEGARVVGPGECAPEVRVVHPLAALEVDGQEGERRPRVQRHGDALGPRALPLEHVDRFAHARIHARVAPFDAEPFRQNPDLQPADPAGQGLGVRGDARRNVSLARVVSIAPGDARERRRHILHGAGYGPHVVDGRLQSEHAGVGHEAVRGHQAHDPAPGGGDADRAALIAAEGDVHFSAGDGRGGAGGRPARHMIPVVGVQGAPVVADTAQARPAPGELLHLELADDRPAGVENARHDGGIEVRNVAVHEMRAERQGHPGDADVVLESDGLAPQWAMVRARDAALPDEDIQGILVLRRPVARITIGEPERRAMLLEAQLVEHLERVDGGHHPRVHDPRLGGREIEAEGLAVRLHLVDVGSPEHPCPPVMRAGRGPPMRSILIPSHGLRAFDAVDYSRPAVW